MQSSRPALLALLLITPCVSHAIAGEPTRYLELVNRAHDTVTAVSAAPAGSGAFQPMPLPAPLRGGGDATTLSVAGEHCRHDLQFTFRDGRSVVYPQVDLCRHRGLRIQPLPRASTGGDARVATSEAAPTP